VARSVHLGVYGCSPTVTKLASVFVRFRAPRLGKLPRPWAVGTDYRFRIPFHACLWFFG
jgi:hypothetical protein